MPVKTGCDFQSWFQVKAESNRCPLKLVFKTEYKVESKACFTLVFMIMNPVRMIVVLMKEMM